MKEYFKHLFTDALGRPEPKSVLGVLFALASLVYIFIFRDAIGFAAISGFSATMFVAGAVGDSVIDRAQK